MLFGVRIEKAAGVLLMDAEDESGTMRAVVRPFWYIIDLIHESQISCVIGLIFLFWVLVIEFKVVSIFGRNLWKT